MSQIESSPDQPIDIGAPLRTLQIIVAALAMGVLSFAAFAVWQSAGQPQVLGKKLDMQNLPLFAIGLVMLPLGFIVPRIVFAVSRTSAPNVPRPVAMDPQSADRFLVLQRIQTSTIIGCALLEGGAFANVFGYMTTRELLHLALAGVLWLGILSFFPTAGRLQRQVDDELRRLDEEKLLKPGR